MGTHLSTSILNRILPDSWRTGIDTVPNAEVSETMKMLLSNTNISTQVQQLIQVAFAEGYATSAKRNSVVCNDKIIVTLHVLLFIIGLVLVLNIDLRDHVFMLFRKTVVPEAHPKDICVTFEDVKGVNKAKQELQKIVEYLCNPKQLSSLGGKLPRGILLTGPTGTGKTLLAQAVAGEAKVPFFHATGPEFKQRTTEQTAKRLGEFFSKAKRSGPCVIFIDEIDSLCTKCTHQPIPNKAVKQLLVELAGLSPDKGVIVMAATNRKKDVEEMLLQPGGFDAHIKLHVPDLSGRKEILQLYLRKVRVGQDVDIDVLADKTVSIAAAGLENLVNQAALKAAADGMDAVTMKYLENALGRSSLGRKRKSLILDEKTSNTIACYEAGYALVFYYTRHSLPVRVTVIPDKAFVRHISKGYKVRKSRMLAEMDPLMAGRAAEELFFGPEDITVAAESDLKHATKIALRMVKGPQWGVLRISELENAEVNQLLSESLERAKNILRAHAKEYEAIVDALLTYTTLDAQTLRSIITYAASAAE